MRSLVDLENRIQLKQAIANDLVNDIEQEAIIVSAPSVSGNTC